MSKPVVEEAPFPPWANRKACRGEVTPELHIWGTIVRNGADVAETEHTFPGLRSEAHYQEAVARMRDGKPHPAAAP